MGNSPELKKLSIRPINQSDKETIYEWRNDRDTVRYSITGRSITQMEHDNWYANLDASGRTCYMAIDSLNNRICFISFQKMNDKEEEISINVNPLLRGKGLSKILLELAIERHGSKNKVLTARILDGNEKSIRLFESSGFHLKSESKSKIRHYFRVQD